MTEGPNLAERLLLGARCPEMRKRLKPPPDPVTPVLFAPAKFSEHHVAPDVFGQLVASPLYWLLAGSALIRAARAIMHQVERDGREMPGSAQRRSRIGVPAVMLAAMGCEDGLKAVIAARKWPHGAKPILAKLPKELKGHDLKRLAEEAAIAPVSAQEASAIGEGRYFIEYAGRYPTMTSAEDTPAGYHHQATALFSAYEEIFLRCGEEVDLIRFPPRPPTPRTVLRRRSKARTALERTIGGVPDA
jgi:hypothetical protein